MINRIYEDMLGFLNVICFLGYDFQSYPNSQKTSLNILTYPFISYHIPTYPKISSRANSQMASGEALIETSWHVWRCRAYF